MPNLKNVVLSYPFEYKNHITLIGSIRFSLPSHVDIGVLRKYLQ